ncbi:hypothetical protein ACYSNW_16980 [Enterococcus sp. LJL99]
MDKKETRQLILNDLAYYQSGIKQLYAKYYQKYFIVLVVIILATITAIASYTSFGRLLAGLLLLVEIASLVYLLRLMSAETFHHFFEQTTEKLPVAFSDMEKMTIQEDDQAYYFSVNDSLVKLNKKNTRNFPSKIPQYTLLVGFSNDIDKETLKKPLYFFYYDITRISYSENYKKELVKNTNFLAKRTRRRVKSFLYSLVILIILFLLFYFG